ncbi:protein-cysteine N-palmitoyltransferase HHAT-like [Amphiura filiformis]|uniref:protein-cysteine N-palmitoyltransferase HHAT-like n=1 Tax=Amphiura filiformis TaxID=82378 RepID=UPI003B221E5D
MASGPEVENISHGEADQNDNAKTTKGHVTDSNYANPLCNPATSTRKTFKHAPLPQLELSLGFAFIIGCVLYVKFRTDVISREHMKDMRLPYFEKAWFPYNHGYRDISDYEWRFWKMNFLTAHILYSVLAYIILGRLVDWIIPELRKVFMLSFGLVFVCITMPARIVMFFAAHTAVAYIGAQSRRRWVVWLVAILQTASIFANLDFYRWQKSFLPGLGDFVVPLTFGILKFISFGLECCKNDDISQDYGLMDLLLYNFYFPLFIGGPVLTFDQFQKQVNRPAGPLSGQEWWNIIKNILRYIFWYFYIDIFLHFSYYSAFHKHPSMFRNLPPKDYPVLAGWHLMFFLIKYIVFYGIPVTIAMFDRIDGPKPPACILSLYTFRDMWRYFDRGIHSMITRYIYFPLGGSRFGLFWNSAGAFVAFSFMALWHGNSYKMYSWAFCNWLGIQLETVLMGLAWTPRALEMQRRLSGPGLRRVCAVAATLNLMFLSLSNMIFLAGYPNIWSYCTGIFIQGFPWVTLVVVTFLYISVQLIMEVQRRYSMDFIYNKKYF